MKIRDVVKTAVTVQSGTSLTYNPNSIAILTSDFPVGGGTDFILTTTDRRVISDAFGDNAHVLKVFDSVMEQSPNPVDYNGTITIVSANQIGQTIKETILGGILQQKTSFNGGRLSITLGNTNAINEYDLDFSTAKSYTDVAKIMQNSIQSGSDDEFTLNITSSDLPDFQFYTMEDGIQWFFTQDKSGTPTYESNDSIWTSPLTLDETWTLTADGTDITVDLTTSENITSTALLQSQIQDAFDTDGRGLICRQDDRNIFALGIENTNTLSPIQSITFASDNSSTKFALADRKGSTDVKLKFTSTASGIPPYELTVSSLSVAPSNAESFIQRFALNLTGASYTNVSGGVSLTSITDFSVEATMVAYTGSESTQVLNATQTRVGSKPMISVEVFYENQRMKITADQGDSISSFGGAVAIELELTNPQIQPAFTASRETLTQMGERLLAKTSVAGICIAIPNTDSMRKDTAVFLQEIMNLATFVQGHDVLFVFCSKNNILLDEAKKGNVQALTQNHTKGIFYQGKSEEDEVAGASLSVCLGVNFTGYNTSKTMNLVTLNGIVPTDEYASNLATSEQIRQDAIRYGLDLYELTNGVEANYFSHHINGFYLDTARDILYMVQTLRYVIYNLLKTTQNIPQTNKGMSLIRSQIEKALLSFRNAGILGTGRAWEGQSPFNIANFNNVFKQNGYVIFIGDISDQNDQDRQARISTPISIAVQMAGKIHQALLDVNVNL